MMKKLAKRFRHWFGFFIVMIGTVSASYALEVERSAFRKGSLHEILQYNLLGTSSDTDWVSMNPADFAISNITHPSDVENSMKGHGYVPVVSRVSLCEFGAVPIFGCDPSGSGMEIYRSESNPEKYIGVSFAPERRLGGCELSVLEVLEFNVLKAEVE